MQNSFWIRHSHFFKADTYECSICHALFKKPYCICPNCETQMGNLKQEEDWVDELLLYDELDDDE